MAISNSQSRGWFAIGQERPKTEANLGTLWRSAYCLGANYIFTIGGRYRHQCSDTVKSWKNIPYFTYPDLDAFLESRPQSARLIGVECDDNARPIETYCHPEQALYLLGPEDGGLSKRATAACSDLIRIDTLQCLNVASAGTVVLYDRQMKAKQKRLTVRLP